MQLLSWINSNLSNSFYSILIILNVWSRPSPWSLEASFQFLNSFPICSSNFAPLPFVYPYQCVSINSLIPLFLPFAKLSKRKCFQNHFSWEKFLIQPIRVHPSQTHQPSTCRATVSLPHLKWKLFPDVFQGRVCLFHTCSPREKNCTSEKPPASLLLPARRCSSGSQQRSELLQKAEPRTPRCEISPYF